VEIPSGETIETFVHCNLPDGIYTFHVVVDPDNIFFESSEFNNEVAIQVLLDRTPPEAEIFFDLSHGDLTVRGVDNLDPSVDVFLTESVIRSKSTRLYSLTDDAGNTTDIYIEINHTSHQIKAEITGLKYNGESVPLPANSFKSEYTIKDGKIRMLNQFLTIGDTKVHLIYNEKQGHTRTIVNGTEELNEGLSLIVIWTKKGDLWYRIEKMR
jgi:hypothetical protein